MSGDIRKGSAVEWRDKSDPASYRGISFSKVYTVEDCQGDVIRVNGLLFDASLFKRAKEPAQ